MARRTLCSREDEKMIWIKSETVPEWKKNGKWEEYMVTVTVLQFSGRAEFELI